MNNEPIQVGDLVIVVRPFCPCGQYVVGRIATVLEIRTVNLTCASRLVLMLGVAAARISDPVCDGFMPLSHLRRIPPLTEDEKQETTEPVTV